MLKVAMPYLWNVLIHLVANFSFFDAMPYQFRDLVGVAGHCYQYPDVWDLSQNKSKSVHVYAGACSYKWHFAPSPPENTLRRPTSAVVFRRCLKNTKQPAVKLMLEGTCKIILLAVMIHVGAHKKNTAQNLWVPGAQKSCHDQVA